MVKISAKLANLIKQMGAASLFASIVWIAISIYNALTTPAQVEVEPKILEPINASIDLDLLKKIGEREQLGENVDSLINEEVPRPSVSPSPTASPSPSINPTPTPSTNSGSVEETGV